MKQLAVLAGLCGLAFLFTYCGGSKKTQASVTQQIPMAKVNFEDSLKPVIVAVCSPCHTPGRGQLPSYLTAATTQKDIDDILQRIQLQPTERGFMPLRGHRLSDTAINLFKHWKADGFVAK